MAKWRFWQFLQSAGKLGGGSVTFAFILFGIGVWEHLKQRNVPAGLLVACGVALFCFGAYQAWLKERLELERHLVSITKPQFQLDIVELQSSFDASAAMTNVLVGASITNHGETSPAMGWTLRLESRSIHMVLAHCSLPYPRTTWNIDARRFFLLTDDMLLDSRTAEAITKGSAKHGRLYFQLPGDVTNDLRSPHSSVFIGTTDRLALPVNSRVSSSVIDQQIKFLPGDVIRHREEETAPEKAPGDTSEA